MALTLRLRSGDVDPAPELPFDAPRIVVGRAPGCDLQLPDPSISPRHASLRQRGADYVVVDEGSDNGTFVGSQRLARHAPHTLRDRDLLRFGRVWVEVRLGPAEHAIEARASRELARGLVDAALSADEKPFGMRVAVEGQEDGEEALVVAEPRRAYLVGARKASDLRVAGVPNRWLELRRQADQLWVTLQSGEGTTLGERELAEGERAAWTKGAVLALGDVRLVASDPTLQMLERLENERTERLAENATVDPPSGGGEEDEDAEEEEGEDEAPVESAEEGIDEVFAGSPGSADALAAGALPRPASSFGRADAIVFLLALSVLGLSLWAIRWLAHLGAA